MIGFFDPGARSPANPPGGRIGGYQLGEFRFQCQQSAQHPIEFGVGDFGAIEHIVEVFVPDQFAAQPGDLCGGLADAWAGGGIGWVHLIGLPRCLIVRR